MNYQESQAMTLTLLAKGIAEHDKTEPVPTADECSMDALLSMALLSAQIRSGEVASADLMAMAHRMVRLAAHARVQHAARKGMTDWLLKKAGIST